MPRAAVPKRKAGAGAEKKPAAGGKKNKLYAMPEKIAEGTLLTDLSKVQWRVGPSIGTGGFGEIYTACRANEKNYDYVVKCEPHGNGPLFVEMHFYMRNAKHDDIQRFKKEHGVKSLGMPHMVGNGSTEINGQKHRFIVMPRYGSDVAKHFLANGRRLPEHTIYRLALQMIDVYEFVHGCGYVHADLKAANILLGYGKGGSAQAYLVDYGLAAHYTTKEFKPDPKKMHNGTIEYTSRDAHQGVPTMRADMEILGYNLIEWLGAQLPWVRDKLLTTPVKVQNAKEQFMTDVSGNLKKIFPNTAPAPIIEFMKYVAKMKYNEKPDYEKCRKIFANTLKTMKVSTTAGDLEFKLKSSSNNNAVPSTSQKAREARARAASPEEDTSIEVLCASDDDDDDVIFHKRIEEKIRSPHRKLKTSIKTKATAPNSSPMKITTKITSPTRKIVTKISPRISPAQRILKASPKRSPKAAPTKPRQSPAQRASKISPRASSRSTPTSSSSALQERKTPVSAKANINFNPSIKVGRSSSSLARTGKTVLNDQLTPNPRAGKTYEFNFELDVSMDANVVVNVKRKKKQMSTEHARTPNGGKEDSGTPVKHVKLRKLASDNDVGDSPRTPAVTVKKSKRLV